MVMCQSATLQHIGVERISFLDALRWLGAPSPGMPLMALIVNPARPHRVEPRVQKRRPKSFPVMINPRQELRQQLIQPAPKGSLHAIRVRDTFFFVVRVAASRSIPVAILGFVNCQGSRHMREGFIYLVAILIDLGSEMKHVFPSI